MSASREWQSEFGVVTRGSSEFFATPADLGNGEVEVSQGHILRRAFALLTLDGVLCADSAPLVYFKEVKRIDPVEVATLHRTFWNHGGAPLLVLISPTEVHVYSGFTKPTAHVNPDGKVVGLIEIVDRASLELREFLPAVESGEYFRRHENSFNPSTRVDRDLLDNLQTTRERLIEISTGSLDAKVLDALLCRLVFACYLFDRGIVGETYLGSLGLSNASHLRDVLNLHPRATARIRLYQLFQELGKDFNGDLFSDNLEAEAKLISAAHLELLDNFFHATDVQSGQMSFWPYDFAAIPIEAISAIYERFLTDKSEGAFYTPRFLAELVLDMALVKTRSLLGLRFLDPSCGSGIFLVGLFNRIAEEWKRNNPGARNDRRARELRKVLCGSLCGIDINPTACRITAFSLYLAYLDQLTRRDIQELREKGHRLPTLVHYPEIADRGHAEGNLWCGDFFSDPNAYPTDADLVIGNPPWGSSTLASSPSGSWCAERQYPIPDKQIATAFLWKAAHHVKEQGNVCLVLPHGVLFNRSKTSLEFQKALFLRHAVDRVLNLVDYQRFLFEDAEHPALVIAYQKAAPENLQHTVEYLAPKADWLVTRAEIITVAPEDRSLLTVGQILFDLQGADAPQVWKQRYWASGRDRRLIDRLSLYPRLRNRVRQTREAAPHKPWIVAVGVQPQPAIPPTNRVCHGKCVATSR